MLACFTGLAVLVVLLPLQSAAADDVCQSAPQPSPTVAEPGWPQAQYDAPAQLWPFSRGAGVTVAVVDTGVDGSHPQLSGKVLTGVDELRNVPQGDVDCDGHGTAVASIVAAQQVSGVGFFGLAPDSSILPVRVSQAAVTAPQAGGAGTPLDPTAVARGIDAAVAGGAQVILVTAVCYSDDPTLAASVARAVDAGALVVAAVGDAHDKNAGTAADADDVKPYPASYPGVLGVGGIDRDGARSASSQVGPYVDLVGPGQDVLADAIKGQAERSDTAVAAAYVAAAAALVIAERPSSLSVTSGSRLGPAVAERLVSTAAPAGGSDAGSYGAGQVDPYAALTERGSGQSARGVPDYSPAPRDPAAERAAAEAARTSSTATLVVGALVGLLVIALLVLVMVPRARRRRWRSGRAERPTRADDDEPTFVPPELLFAPKDDAVHERR